MFGNLDLRLTKNVLKVTDAERRSYKKLENAQPRAIAKALIDSDQVHGDQQQVAEVAQQGAAVSRSRRSRPTLRPTAPQYQIQVVALWCGFSNWILRYDTAVVFDIYIQVCTWYQSIP